MRSTGIEVVTEGLLFPEGPTWHDGALWVSDVIAGRVVRIDGDGAVTERHLEGRRGIGGLLVTEDGRLLATGPDLVDVVTGETVLSRPHGATGFNDIGVDANGAVLIGVLTYRPLAGDKPTAGSVARLNGDGVDWTWFEPITWPNGIASLTDGRTAVADYHDGALWLLADDDAPELICRSPHGEYDGLCVDDDDHIWVATGTGGTVERRDAAGRLVDEIHLPASFVTSVCFAGDDPRTLLATVSGSSAIDGTGGVLAITVATPGHPPGPARLGALTTDRTTSHEGATP